MKQPGTTAVRALRLMQERLKYVYNYKYQPKRESNHHSLVLRRLLQIH